MCVHCKTDNPHTKTSTKNLKIMSWKDWLPSESVPMWQSPPPPPPPHSGWFWVFKSLCKRGVNACMTVLLVTAGLEASPGLVFKSHVNLPSARWLQHRLHSWYTCSITEWDPLSGSWPKSKYAPFSIYIEHFGSTNCDIYLNAFVGSIINPTISCSFYQQMRDTDRCKHQLLSGHIAISASAGPGKTWTAIFCFGLTFT